MQRKITVAVAAAALAVVPMTAAMADGHETAEVVIVHVVPGLEVDILVDGDVALPGVNFEDIAVVDLPAGTYDLAVNAAGTEDQALGAEGAELTAGVSYSVIAHLTEGGDPTLTLEANVTDEGAGIQVFHMAAFPAVDIQPVEATGLEGVANGMTACIATGAGTVPGDGVAAAGEAEAALPLSPFPKTPPCSPTPSVTPTRSPL